jgi:hypothetical protein
MSENSVQWVVPTKNKLARAALLQNAQFRGKGNQANAN